MTADFISEQAKSLKTGNLVDWMFPEMFKDSQVSISWVQEK